MSLSDIPCILMRGGTSRAPYFNAKDLPTDRDALAQVLIAAMGAGSPLQVDGIGGAQPTTSKVAILSASDHDWAEVDYLFAQVHTEKAEVDFSPSCGNILSGVGPAAIEMNLIAGNTDQTQVRIRNVNTSALIEAVVQTPNGRVRYDGNARIDGVPGTAAPIVLNFMQVVGSKTGALFPTGNPIDVVQGVEVSCVDVAMPMVIARARDLGVSGLESREALDANTALFERIESIRIEAGKKMGLGDVSQSVVPKFGLLTAPANGGAITGRYFMPWSCHPAYAVTGSICTGACLLSPATVADGLASIPPASPASVVIEHPSGSIEVVFDYTLENGAFVLNSAGVMRTARRLFTGAVSVPQTVLT